MFCKIGAVRSSLGSCSLAGGVSRRSLPSLNFHRSLSTEKTDPPKVAGEDARHKKQPVAKPTADVSVTVSKSAVKKRRFVTSARILPDGFVRPALYDQETPIPRCESYPPMTYYMEVFPWLLSAQRQRTPMDDLDGTTDAGTNSACLASAAMRCLPVAARRSLAQTLNVHIARSALGQRALDDLCAGATAALPEIARLLTAASAGDAEASSGLEHIFTAPLLARYRNDLGRLREDNVHLSLLVRRINSARIHQLRTETGPAEAYAAADACRNQHRQHSSQKGETMSVLRAGLARQKYQYTNVFGASYAAPGAHQQQQQHHQHQQQQQCQSSGSEEASADPSVLSALSQARSWATGMLDVASGKAPVRVRVDVELNADMRYQLIGRHKTPTDYDIHKDTSKVIVDDDATRNLMLTLESTTSSLGQQAPSFQWRVADIDYLLSSEQRIRYELEEARQI